MEPNIKPIRTDADYQETLERVNRLMDAKPGSPDFDTLCILTDLVRMYEQRNFLVDLPDPVEAIRFEIEQSGKTVEDLQSIVGSSVNVSEVMNGKRKMTLRMIRALHRSLGIPYDILMQDSPRVA
jgi:HTH-type transcriptional regulator/antitoxin HigA